MSLSKKSAAMTLQVREQGLGGDLANPPLTLSPGVASRHTKRCLTCNVLIALGNIAGQCDKCVADIPIPSCNASKRPVSSTSVTSHNPNLLSFSGKSRRPSGSLVGVEQRPLPQSSEERVSVIGDCGDNQPSDPSLHRETAMSGPAGVMPPPKVVLANNQTPGETVATGNRPFNRQETLRVLHSPGPPWGNGFCRIWLIPRPQIRFRPRLLPGDIIRTGLRPSIGNRKGSGILMGP